MTPVVCITGASAGIGEALALVYAEQGCHLVLGARRLQKLQALEGILKEKGAASVVCLPLDVRSNESVQAWVQAALQKHSHLDILVNNAGLVIGLEPVETGRVDDWETILDTNVLGVMRVTQALIPVFKKQNAGHIVMIGSIAGHQPYENGGAYCASKFGVRALTGVLKHELNGTGIRVSTVDPGMVETEFSVVRFRGDANKAKQVYKGLTPLNGRDIAECVQFMTSRPPHVNIDSIVVMPTAQASVYKVHRQS
ncbi:MAG TPA: SDR family NAD(P)-dependent oxidoreductase [Oligoflexus sp.]|uniref:SDR family NAD(P)-dependent oxidoreductase n=1 Tax=Oligoflexus sp. TaxID=1971216 RepID=UPI002D4F263E|nr:SDR family NAD(P)-dependent oxidoreductase [Oligoflexus sp.]HYX38061.1 SDR family NAD(P)-dependent oxidoreductase [Oligoflexus sp.]